MQLDDFLFHGVSGLLKVTTILRTRGAVAVAGSRGWWVGHRVAAGMGGGTEGDLGAMDRAACLNLNTRSFKHRSPSRIQIIARTQAWSHTCSLQVTP